MTVVSGVLHRVYPIMAVSSRHAMCQVEGALDSSLRCNAVSSCCCHQQHCAIPFKCLGGWSRRERVGGTSHRGRGMRICELISSVLSMTCVDQYHITIVFSRKAYPFTLPREAPADSRSSLGSLTPSGSPHLHPSSDGYQHNCDTVTQACMHRLRHSESRKSAASHRPSTRIWLGKLGSGGRPRRLHLQSQRNWGPRGSRSSSNTCAVMTGTQFTTQESRSSAQPWQ